MPITKTYPEDPNRCQATTSQGQCINKANEGSQFCLAHGGNRGKQVEQENALRIYRLGRWQFRLEEMSSQPDIKSLRDEIGILRILLEERFSICQTNTDLMIHSTAISDLVMKVERVVATCHKLEGSMGKLVDKSALLQFAANIIKIIGDEISDPDILDTIGTRIMSCLQE